MMIDQPVIYREAPSWNGLRTAAIGCFEFPDVRSGSDFLTSACQRLRAEGYQAVIGPMDGSTWRPYRLRIWSDNSCSFAMEPDAGPHDLACYERAGFGVVESHSSATAEPGSRGWGNAARGVTVESWNGQQPELLLDQAYQIVMQGFANTPFFSELSKGQFVGAYLSLLARCDPRFILRAMTVDGSPVGLTLAFPDPIRSRAVVLKTYVGLLPGTGRAMADRVHELAYELGYDEVIHALMRDGIVSQAQSRKFGSHVFRRYALMGRRL